MVHVSARSVYFSFEARGFLCSKYSVAIDVHDQPAIVRQYMRFTRQINSGKDVRNAILRGLQM